MEKNGKKKKTTSLVIILVLILVVLLIYSFIFANRKQPDNTIVEEEIVQPDNNTNPNVVTDLSELSQMQQYDRIKYYMDKYLFYIEEQNYELAYSLLHDDFKQEHFKTLEEFKQYVINKYPVVNTIEYEKYDKLGMYHILTIKFIDVLNSTSNNIPSFEQKYIIVENGLNDFKLSFQVE